MERMTGLPLTRRQLMGGGLLLAGGFVLGHAIGHRPLAPVDSFLGSARHTLAAAFEALLPSPERAEALAADVDAFLGAGDPVLSGQLRLALHVLEHLGGTGLFRFERFSRLSVERRAEVLEDWRSSRVGPKRQIGDAVRRVVLFTWYSHPDSWAAIGYDGPWVGK